MQDSFDTISRDSRTRRGGFTLIELLVVIAIIALLIGILLPALGQARQSGRKLVSANNQRQVMVGFQSFAESNRGHFPGVDGGGTTFGQVFADASDINDWNIGGGGAGRHIPARFLLALQDGFTVAETLTSPAEPREFLPDYRVAENVMGPRLNGPVWVDWVAGGWERASLRFPYTLETVFYSYAALDLFNQDVQNGVVFLPLVKAWSNESNSMSALMTDRLIFWTEQQHNDHNAAATKEQKDKLRQSLWQKDSGGWQGHVAYGDGHVEWSTTSILSVTSYGGYYNEGNNNANNGNNAAAIDRSGDDLFSINSGYGAQTRDAGMVVGWGSQTFRHGSDNNRVR